MSPPSTASNWTTTPTNAASSPVERSRANSTPVSHSNAFQRSSRGLPLAAAAAKKASCNRSRCRRNRARVGPVPVAGEHPPQRHPRPFHRRPLPATLRTVQPVLWERGTGGEGNGGRGECGMVGYLLYGANGYTAQLIAYEATKHGPPPILAGRNADAVGALARQLNLEHRVFALDDPAAVDAGLKDVAVVLNCAGPFSRTAKPMADACLRRRVHYLDVTGEISVFEELAGHDAEAQAAGVMLMPGAGFDVVPSDCLAAHLKRRLPTANKLALGFQALGGFSRGTATTMVENLPKGGMIRRGGVLTHVPTAWRTRVIDFGRGPVRAMTIPWGDVATAYRSTGIPDIEVYAAASLSQVIAGRFLRWFGWVTGSRAVQGYLKRRIRRGDPARRTRNAPAAKVSCGARPRTPPAVASCRGCAGRRGTR